MKKVIRIARLLAAFIVLVFLAIYGVVIYIGRAFLEAMELVGFEIRCFDSELDELTKKL